MQPRIWESSADYTQEKRRGFQDQFDKELKSAQSRDLQATNASRAAEDALKEAKRMKNQALHRVV